MDALHWRHFSWLTRRAMTQGIICGPFRFKQLYGTCRSTDRAGLSRAAGAKKIAQGGQRETGSCFADCRSRADCWSAGHGLALEAADVRYYQENGVTYRETRYKVQHPVTETVLVDQSRITYREKVDTELQRHGPHVPGARHQLPQRNVCGQPLESVCQAGDCPAVGAGDPDGNPHRNRQGSA